MFINEVSGRVGAQEEMGESRTSQQSSLWSHPAFQELHSNQLMSLQLHC